MANGAEAGLNDLPPSQQWPRTPEGDTRRLPPEGSALAILPKPEARIPANTQIQHQLEKTNQNRASQDRRARQATPQGQLWDSSPGRGLMAHAPVILNTSPRLKDAQRVCQGDNNGAAGRALRQPWGRATAAHKYP